MTPSALQAWRSRMGWTAKEAAAQLGLSQNGYAAYERGWVRCMAKGAIGPARTFRLIPKHVELACCELERRATGQTTIVGYVGDALSAITRKALRDADITPTVEALSEKTDAELLALPNLGRKSLNEIREVVAAAQCKPHDQEKKYGPQSRSS